MAACDDAPAAYRWECLLYENGWPDEFNWKDDNCSVVACYADNFVQPLIKLGLVAVVQRGFVDFYAPTSKGVATWERAIKDGKIPERD
jgi:hypothetical protein